MSIDDVTKIGDFYRHDVTKIGDFYNGGLWRNFSFLIGSNWNLVPGYIKNVDTHPDIFSSKKQVIKSNRQKAFDKLIWNEQ